jgi:hypothetical protein
MRLFTMQKILKKHEMFLQYDYFCVDQNYVEIVPAISLNDKATAELV